MAIYGFIAAVLPVWVLLVPRDYLSSFLKIGTIALLVIGTLIANPKLEAMPAFANNHVFANGGRTVAGERYFRFYSSPSCCPGAIEAAFIRWLAVARRRRVIQKQKPMPEPSATGRC